VRQAQAYRSEATAPDAHQTLRKPTAAPPVAHQSMLHKTNTSHTYWSNTSKHKHTDTRKLRKQR
jgi:hypothetical protein